MLPLNSIVEGNCLEVMREWSEESIDLVRDSKGCHDWVHSNENMDSKFLRG